MKLTYNPEGTFVPEARKLAQELEADAVMLIVFGSETKGSGACCEMRTNDPVRLGRILIENLRGLADSLESDMEEGALTEALHDYDQHEQEKLEHPERELRSGEPSNGNHI